MLRKLLTTIALATAITVPMAGPAIAAEPTSVHLATTPHTTGVGSAAARLGVYQLRSNDTSAAAAPNDVCQWAAYGVVGYTICGYTIGAIQWSDTDTEWFVVGTDYAIWHIWQGGGGWVSLGGQANRSLTTNVTNTPNGVYPYYCSGTRGVETYGTDGRWWCRDWNWTNPWYPCIGP